MREPIYISIVIVAVISMFAASAFAGGSCL